MRKILTPQRKLKSILKHHPRRKRAFSAFIENVMTETGQLLPLLTIKLLNDNRLHRICALLDTGSDTSYIARHVLDKVSHKISHRKVSFDIQTLNARKTIQTNAVQVKVAQKDGTYKRMQFYVQDQPLRIEQEPCKELQSNPHLSDAMRTRQTQIDAIIGVDLLTYFLRSIHIMRDQGLIMFKTTCGTTYSGAPHIARNTPTTRQFATTTSKQARQLNAKARNDRDFVPGPIKQDTLI